ncbi:WD40 repeat domain-containing serine/threonine protein kinase [Engelhardtia mirabilis]|uniref:Serine/threonine-protein kinase PknB n=1 Tax=Engelhardtia mirabilis TaxID=2528011 RepID=A0A518BFW2_9BACT|nr:Serine/threonine-protein kinase PknB [Planctomycetes bacterium Pla133]QDV00191.1 Serine/threonine-protein kinase PknB [Planctomycetes bacterium Pla86]
MTQGSRARLAAVFAQAVELPDAERPAFLERACGDDPQLRAEVERLLEFDSASMGFLGEDQIDSSREQLESVLEGSRQLVRSADPDRIGPYRVLRRVGEGGMGIVYEAEQDSPRRRVALKVVKPLLATPSRMARFRQEAELLGRLQHPGIAQVYELGTFDFGHGPQPYFALELVDGSDLATYVAEHRLSVRDRLALLVQVCEAVDHAHQRGVIHRDLKPENIMVDAEGRPKVLDFGVARATEGSTVLTTLVTEEGDLLGTIAYMAPEQLEGHIEEITPRTDVYSLGAVAFELLTGRPPHELLGLPLAAAIQLALAGDPPAPSTLRPELAGDVETVVVHALEKEPARRYASAAELAADLEAVLEDRPILARPPSRRYRALKFARRNRALVGGVTGTFLAILLGLATSLHLWGREREQRGLLQLASAELRRGEAQLVGGVMASAREALEQGDVWGAVKQHSRVPESRRGWAWRLFRRRLPVLLDLESDVAILPEPALPRWRFAGDDHLYALDLARDAVRLIPLDGPEQEFEREFERFAGMGLRWVDVATPTGWALGWADGETVLLDLFGGRVVRRWSTPWNRELGQASHDGEVVVVQQGPDLATVFDRGRAISSLDCGGADSAIAQRHCRLSPAGDRVFVNRLSEVAIVDLGTGVERVHRPGPGFDRILGEPIDGGWVSHQWVETERGRTASRIQLEEVPVLDECLLITEHTGRASFATPRDGRFVAIGSHGWVELRDTLAADPYVVSRFQDQDGRLDRGAEFSVVGEVSPSGKRLLALAHGDYRPWLVDLAESAIGADVDSRSRSVQIHDRVLYHLAVSPDGSLAAATGPRMDAVLVCDATTLEPLARLERRAVDFGSRDALLAFSDDSRRLVMSTPMVGFDGVVVVEWDLVGGGVTVTEPGVEVTGGNHVQLLDEFIGRLEPSERARLSQKVQMAGPRAVAVNRAYERSSDWKENPSGAGRRWATLATPGRAPRADLTALSVHPFEDLVAHIAGYEVNPGDSASSGQLSVRRLDGGELVNQVKLDHKPWCVSYSPDGQTLAVGCSGGWIQIYETEFLALQHEFRATRGYVYSLAFLPDGERLASVGEDGQLRVWDPRPQRVQDAARQAWSERRAELAARPELEAELPLLSGEERAAALIGLIRRRWSSEPRGR